MCGIGGFSSSKEVQKSLVKIVADGIHYRGLDGQSQIHLDQGKTVLIHSRLSIIGGHEGAQPMSDATGRFTIVFNGEIFNYRSLAHKHHLPVESDTRLLVELWAREGHKALRLLRGQYSFAIFDNTNNTTTLVRDEFGVLPLFVAFPGGDMAFSSNARALSAVLDSSPVAQADEIRGWLRDRFVPENRTLWGEVSEVPKEYAITYKHGHELHREKHSSTKSSRDIRVDLLDLMLRRSKEVVVADCEVGFLFSGGLDSSLAAKFCSPELPYRPKAFVAHWGASNLSELKQARLAAERLNLELVEVEVTALDWWQALKKTSESRDAPNGELADPVYFLLTQKAAGSKVRVLISGEGADEIFMGYTKYAIEKYFPKGLPKLITLPISWALRLTGRFKNLDLFEKAIVREDSQRVARYFATPSLTSHALGGDTSVEVPLNSLQSWDLENYLPKVLLPRADFAGMLNQVEIRPFYLDREFLNFARAAGPEGLVKCAQTKAPLKKLAKNANIDFGLVKRGFPVPFSAWLRADLLPELERIFQAPHPIIDLVVSANSRSRMLFEHKASQADHSRLIFVLVSLKMWLEGTTNEIQMATSPVESNADSGASA